MPHWVSLLKARTTGKSALVSSDCQPSVSTVLYYACGCGTSPSFAWLWCIGKSLICVLDGAFGLILDVVCRPLEMRALVWTNVSEAPGIVREHARWTLNRRQPWARRTRKEWMGKCWAEVVNQSGVSQVHTHNSLIDALSLLSIADGFMFSCLVPPNLGTTSTEDRGPRDRGALYGGQAMTYANPLTDTYGYTMLLLSVMK